MSAVRYHLTGKALPSKYETVALTDALRRAALSRFGNQNGGGKTEILAGKDADGRKLTDNNRHAHYLALTADHHRTGADRLDTLVVWAPGGLDPDAVDALLTIRRLTAHAIRPCLLGVEGVGTITDVAPELVGPARTWHTMTPMAITRHQPRNRKHAEFAQDEAVRNLTLAGLGDVPVTSIVLPHSDALDFRRHRLAERLHQARRAHHVEITFEDRVQGPIVLGALSHFGLGLLLPVTA